MLNNSLKPGTTSEPSIFMIGWLNHAPPPTVSVLCLVGGKPHLPFGLYMFYNVVQLSWCFVRNWHWVYFERGFKGCSLDEQANRSIYFCLRITKKRVCLWVSYSDQTLRDMSKRFAHIYLGIKISVEFVNGWNCFF